MKKLLVLILCVFVVAVMMSGCTGKPANDTTKTVTKATPVKTMAPVIKAPVKTCDDKEIKTMVYGWVGAKFAKVSNYGKIGMYHSALIEANTGLTEIKDLRFKFRQLKPCKYVKSHEYYSDALDKYVTAMELTVSGTKLADDTDGAKGSELIIQGNDVLNEAQRLQTRADDYLE